MNSIRFMPKGITTLVALTAALCLCAFNVARAETNLVLSKDGRTDYVIARAKSASPVEIAAAADLSKYLRAASGAEFKVVEEDFVPSETPAIYVGQTDFAKQSGVQFDQLGAEEWVIKTTPDGSLILSGGWPRGPVYAVYEFLETQLGVHWLDEKTEVIPSMASLAIKPLDIKGQPYFRMRWFFDRLDWTPVSGLFKLRNKGFSYTQTDNGIANLLGRPGPHHTFYHYSKNWPADKPELFSLNKEGKRLIATSGEGPGQLCLTNPEVTQRVLAELRSFIAEDRKEAKASGIPAPTVYDISINDNHDKCVCENCSKLAEKEGQSGVLLTFINAVADDIKKDYPKLFIRTFAYMYTAKAPKNIRAADNVIIHLAMVGVEFGGDYYYRDTMRGISAPENKMTRENVEAWGEKAENIAMWDYWILYPMEPEPFVKVASIQENMAFYKKENVKYMFVECENPNFTNFFALTRFLGYKFMQNPEQDAQPWIDLFVKNYYGKAAPTMVELLKYLEKRQEENEGAIGGVDVASRKYLDLDYFKTSLGLLDRAEREVADDPRLLANVRRERVAILAGLFARWGQIAGVEKEFEGAALLNEFDTLSLESLNYYFSGSDTQNFRPEIAARLEKAKERFRDNVIKPPLPAGLSSEVFDAPLSYFLLNPKTAMITDPAAARGKAIAFDVDKAWDPQNKTKHKDIKVGISNWMEAGKLLEGKISLGDLENDGKYHLAKIGSVTFPNNSRAHLYVGDPEGIKMELYRMFTPNSSYDVYVSVKAQGPRFFEGSDQKNQILVDRILFVSQNASEEGSVKDNTISQN